MDNIQAGMLLPQLERLDRKLEMRERLARLYHERLDGLNWLQIPSLPRGAVHARHLFPVWVDAALRDRMIKGLHEAGVPTVVNYRAIHLTSFLGGQLGHARGDFPVAESIGDRTLSLPFYPTMPDHHVDIVCNAVKAVAEGAGW
jgi:UDP-4-amino-4-deoxy-L-arabinose-oxoglutarate aminotransferase